MKSDTRKYVFFVIFILIGILYISKLFYMQVIDDKWKLRAQQIAEKRREITPPRAVVYDRNGRKIISNKTYYNLMMVEKNIKELDTTAFAKLIGWTVKDVRERFVSIKEGEGEYYNKHTGKTTSNYQTIRPYPFIKELTAEEMAKIAPYLDNFPGFYKEVTSMRNYPYPHGANIMGYLAEVNRDEVERDKFYKPGAHIGRSGIERYYEKEFRGKKGVKYIVTSAMNNVVGSFENGKYDTLAVQAPPIKLGLDIELQAYGEKLLKNKRGCIVAIEPKTGEILAMVSSPNFDPNLLVGSRKIMENYPALLKDPDKPLFSRPLASQYMPGSTFKLLQSLIGLQEGVINKNTGFPCNKSIVGCHNHPSATNVSDAVKMSCNPYFYAVTRRIIQQGVKTNSFEDSEIGLGKWAEYMHSFGLGQKLKVDIFGAKPGLIPTPEYYDRWYGHHQWKFSTIRSISIGQGEVQLTPLQLANVAVIMANRGWYITPHFVKGFGNEGPREEYLIKHKTKIDYQHFLPVVEGMRRVVYEAGGTARRAQVEGVVVCGKTGTVENYRGKLKLKNHSVFIAFAPMDNPKIAISVFIENAGGGGGTWAAPVASLMIEQYIYGKVKPSAKEKRILDAVLLKKER